MIFRENHLLPDSHEISYLIFSKIGKMTQNLMPIAVVIGALRVKQGPLKIMRHLYIGPILLTLTMLNRDISCFA